MLLVVISWSLCVATSAMLLYSLWRSPGLIIKPSIAFLVFYNIRVQLGATLNMDEAVELLPDPLAFVILVEVFPFAATILSLQFGRGMAKVIWTRASAQRFDVSRRVLVWLVGYAFVVTAWYLVNVPVQRSGLYALIAAPSESQIVREESFKLIDSAALRYAFSFFRFAVGPMLAVIAGHSLCLAFQRGSVVGTFVFILIIAFVLIGVSLPGARAPASFVLMAVLFSRVVMASSASRLGYLAAAPVLLLTIPALFTIFREEQAMSWSVYGEYLVWMWKRAIMVPSEVGLWYAHYAQTDGFIGLAGNSKIAALLGIEAIPLDNIIGLTYGTGVLQSVSAGTNFVVGYYACFGMASTPVCLMLLLLLDSVLFVYIRLSNRLLVPALSSTFVSVASFLEAEYTTALITNGFVVIIVVAWCLDGGLAWRFRNACKKSVSLN